MPDEDLNMNVFNHFKQWGQLLNVKVLKDGLRRPYAFVQFEVRAYIKLWLPCSISNITLSLIINHLFLFLLQQQFEKDSKKALQEAPGTFINDRSIRCEPARVNRSICLISFNQPFNKKVNHSEQLYFSFKEEV